MKVRSEDSRLFQPAPYAQDFPSPPFHCHLTGFSVPAWRLHKICTMVHNSPKAQFNQNNLQTSLKQKQKQLSHKSKTDCLNTKIDL